jgi:hypothetical protein
MRVFFWILGVLFALAAFPALFYFVLYLLRGDDILRERAGKFYAWAKFVFLITFNFGIWGHVVVALLQIWGVLR